MIKCLKSPLLSKYGKKYPRLCPPVQKYYNAQNFIFWLKITFFFLNVTLKFNQQR